MSLSPVPPSRGAIAKTFWGKAWCTNLERYGDFVTYRPPLRAGTLLLWRGPPALLLGGGLLLWRRLRDPQGAAS